MSSTSPLSPNKQSSLALTIAPLDSKQPCPISLLPNEALLKILALITKPDDMESAELTCRLFHLLSRDQETKKERDENQRIEKIDTKEFSDAVNELATLTCIPDINDEVLKEKANILYRCIDRVLAQEAERIPYHKCKPFVTTTYNLLKNRCEGMLSRFDRIAVRENQPKIDKHQQAIKRILNGEFDDHAISRLINKSSFNGIRLEVFLENVSTLATTLISPTTDEVNKLESRIMEKAFNYVIEKISKHKSEEFRNAFETFYNSLCDGSEDVEIGKKWVQYGDVFNNAAAENLDEDKDFKLLFPVANQKNANFLTMMVNICFLRSCGSMREKIKASHPEISTAVVDQLYTTFFQPAFESVASLSIGYLVGSTIVQDIKKNRSLKLVLKNALRYYSLALQDPNPESKKKDFIITLVRTCGYSNYPTPFFSDEGNWLEDILKGKAPSVNLEEARKAIISDILQQKKADIKQKIFLLETELKTLQGPNQFDGTLNTAWVAFKKAENELANCYKEASVLLGQTVDDSTELSALQSFTLSRKEIDKLAVIIHDMRIAHMKAERAFSRLKAKHDHLAQYNEGTYAPAKGKFFELMTLLDKLEKNDPEALESFEKEEDKTINEQLQNLQDNIQLFQTLVAEYLPPQANNQ